MGRALAIWLRLLGAAVAGQMSFRQSFLLELGGRFGVTMLELIGVIAVFDHIDALAGWTRWEVAYLYGMASMALGLAELLADGLKDMTELVRQGTLDGILVRPVSPLVQVLGRRFRLHHLGRLLQGALVTGTSLVLLRWSPGPVALLMLLVNVLGTATVFFAVFLFAAATKIHTVESKEAFNAFTYGGVQMAQFPLPVYPDWLRWLFLFAVPVGFTAYFPALLVLGKVDTLGFGPLAPWLAPAVAGAFLGLSLLWWRSSLNHYQSTGS